MASEAESFVTQITEEGNDKPDCPEAGQPDQAEVIITQIINQKQDSKAETSQEATEKTSQKPSVDTDGDEREKGEVFINEEVDRGVHVGEKVSEHMQEKKEDSEAHVAISDHKSLPRDQARDGPESVLNQTLERTNTDDKSEINTGDQERCIERTLPKAMLALQENFESTVCKGHKLQSIAAVEGSEEKVQNENKEILKNSNEETLFNGLADIVGAQTATSFVDEEEALISPKSSRLEEKKRCSQGGIDIALGGPSNYAFEECCQDTSKSCERGRDEITVENKKVESYIVHQEAVDSEKVENNSALTLICRTDLEKVTIKDVLHKDNQQNDSPKRVAQNPIEENSCILVSEDELCCHQKGQGLARVQASTEKEMDNGERNTNSSELMKAEECIEKTATKLDETEREILEENMEMVSEENGVVKATEEAAFPRQSEEKLDVVSGNQGQENDRLETDNVGTTGILQDKTSGAVKERSGFEDIDISQNENDSSFEYEEVDLSLGKKDENKEGSSNFEPTQQEEQDNEASSEQKIHNQQVSEVNKSTESIVLGNSDEEEITKNMNSPTSRRQEGKSAQLLKLEPERGQETKDAEGSTESDIRRNEIQRDQHKYTTISNEAVSSEKLNSPEIKKNMIANMAEEAVDLTYQQDKGEDYLNKAALNLSQNICEEGDIMNRSSKEGTMIEETTEKLTHSDQNIEQIKEEDPEKIIAETESIPCVHTTRTTQASETSLKSSISTEMKHKCSFDLPQGYSTKECNRSRMDEPDIVEDDGIINKELLENSEHRDQDQENSIDFEDTGPDIDPKGNINKMNADANISNGRLQIDDTKKETTLVREIFRQDDKGFNNRSDIVSAGKNLEPVDAVEMIECCLESAATCGINTSSAEANKLGTEESRDVNILLEEHQGLRVTEVKVEEEDEDSLNKVQGDKETKKTVLNEESPGEEEDIGEDAHDVMVEKAGDTICIDEEVHHVTGDKVDDEDKFEKANADPPQQHSDQATMTKSDNIEYGKEREQNGSNEMYGTNSVEEKEIVNRICEESCGYGKGNQEIINEAPPSHNENTKICMDSIQVTEAKEESAHDKQLKNIEDVGPDNISDCFSAIEITDPTVPVEKLECGSKSTNFIKPGKGDSEVSSRDVDEADTISAENLIHNRYEDAKLLGTNENIMANFTMEKPTDANQSAEELQLIEEFQGNERTSNDKDFQQEITSEGIKNEVKYMDATSDPSQLESKRTSMSDSMQVQEYRKTYELEKSSEMDGLDMANEKELLIQGSEADKASIEIPNHQISESFEPPAKSIGWEDQSHEESKDEENVIKVNTEAGLMCHAREHKHLENNPNRVDSVENPEYSSKSIAASQGSISAEETDSQVIYVDTPTSASKGESMIADVKDIVAKEPDASQVAMTSEQSAPIGSQSCEDVLAPKFDIKKEANIKEEKQEVDCYQTESTTESTNAEITNNLFEEPGAPVAAKTLEEYDPLEKIQSSEDSLGPELEIPKEGINEEENYGETENKTDTSFPMVEYDLSEDPYTFIAASTSEKDPKFDIPKEENEEEKQEIDSDETAEKTKSATAEAGDDVSKKPDASIPTEKIEDCAPLEQNRSSKDVLVPELDIPEEDTKEKEQEIDRDQTENMIDTVIGEVRDHLFEKTKETSKECKQSKDSQPSEYILGQELDMSKEGIKEEGEVFETENKTGTVNIGNENDLLGKRGALSAATSDECNPSKESRLSENILAPELDIPKDENKQTKQDVKTGETANETEAVIAEVEDDVPEKPAAPITAKTFEECQPLEQNQSSGDVITTGHAELEDDVAEESAAPITARTLEECEPLEQNQSPGDVIDTEHAEVEDDVPKEPSAPITAKTFEEREPLAQYESLGDVIAIEHEIAKEGNYEKEKQGVDCSRTENMTGTVNAEVEDQFSEVPGTSTAGKASEVEDQFSEVPGTSTAGKASQEYKQLLDCPSSEDVLDQKFDIPKEATKEEETGECGETENKTELMNPEIEENLSKEPGYLIEENTPEERNPMDESQSFEDVQGHKWNIPTEAIKEEEKGTNSSETENKTKAVNLELKDDFLKEPCSLITEETSAACEPSEDIQSPKCVKTPEFDVTKGGIKENLEVDFGETETKIQVATREVEDDVSQETDALVADSKECTTMEPSQASANVLVPDLDLPKEGDKKEVKPGVDSNLTEDTKENVIAEVKDDLSENAEKTSEEDTKENVIAEVKDDLSENAEKTSEECKQLKENPSSEEFLGQELNISKEGIKKEGEVFETEKKTATKKPEIENDLFVKPVALNAEKRSEECNTIEEVQSSENVLAPEFDILEEDNKQKKQQVKIGETENETEAEIAEVEDEMPEDPSPSITAKKSEECVTFKRKQALAVLDHEFDTAKEGNNEEGKKVVDCGQTENMTGTVNEELKDDFSQVLGAQIAGKAYEECDPLEESKSPEIVLDPELNILEEGVKEEEMGGNYDEPENNKEIINPEVEDEISEEPGSSIATNTSEECKPSEETQSLEDVEGLELNNSTEGIKEEEKKGDCSETVDQTETENPELKDDLFEEPSSLVTDKTSKECEPSEDIQSCKYVLVPEFDNPKEGFGEKLEVDFGETAKETEVVTTEVEYDVSQESDASIAATTSEECAAMEPSQSSTDFMVAELDIPKADIKKEEKQEVNCDETANKAEAENQHDSDEPGVPIATETLAEHVPSEETQSSKDVQASKFNIPKEHNKEANQNEDSNETAIETETVTPEVKDDLSEGPKTAEENAPLEKSQSDLAPGLDNPKEGIQEEEKQGANKTKTQDLEAKDDLCKDLDASIESKNLVVSTEDNELADVGKEFPPEVEKLENLAADVVEKISFPDIEHQSGNVASTVINANLSVKEMLSDNCQEVNVIAADALVGIQILQANERPEQIWQPSTDKLEYKHTSASTNEETGENTTIQALKQDKPGGYHPENTRHDTHLAEEKQRELDESSLDLEPSMHMQSELEVMENASTTDESLMSEPGDASVQGASASLGTKRKSQSYSDNDYQRLEGPDLINIDEAEEVKRHNVVSNQLVVHENQSENFGEHETTVCDTTTEETLVPADPLEKLEGSSELLKSSEEATKLDETDRAENIEATAESYITRSAETLIGDDYKDKKSCNIEGNEIKRHECSLLIAEDPHQASKGLEISDHSNSIDEEPTMEDSQQARTRERTDSNSIEVNSKDAKGYAPEPPSQSNTSELDNLELQKDEFAHEVTGSNDTAGSDSEKGDLVNQGSDEGITSSIAKSIPQMYQGVEASGLPREAERNVQNQDESTEIHGNGIEGVKLDEMETKETKHHLISTEVKCMEKPDSEMDKTREEMKDSLQEELIGSNATNSEDRTAIKESDEPEETPQEFDVAIENTIKDQQVVACHDNMLIVKDMTLLTSFQEPHSQRNIEKAFDMHAFEEDTQANGARLLPENVEKLEDLAAKQAKEITSSLQLGREDNNVASKEIDANKPTKTLVDGTDEGVQVSNEKSPITSHGIEELTAADIIASQISLAIEREEQLQQPCSQKLEDIQEAKITTGNNTLNQVLEDADDRKTLSEARKRELEIFDSKYESNKDCLANQELGQKVGTSDASSTTEPEDLPSQFQGANPPSESETNRKPETCTSDPPHEILNAKGSNKPGVPSNVPPHIDTKSHTIPQENLGASCKLSKKSKTEGHDHILELHGEGHTKSEKIDLEQLKTTSSGLITVQKGAWHFEAHEATIGNVAREEVEATKDAQGVSRGSVGEDTKAQASEKIAGEDEKQAKIATEKENTDEKVLCHDPKMLQERLQATESLNKTEKAVIINEQERNVKCIVPTATRQANEQTTLKGSFIVAEIPHTDASNLVLKTPETTEQRKDSLTEVSNSPIKPKNQEQASNATDGFPFHKYPKDTDEKQFKLHMENQQESEQGPSEENQVRHKDHQDKDSLKAQQMKDVRELGNTNVQSTLIKKEDGEQILSTEKTTNIEDIIVGGMKIDEEKDQKENYEHQKDSDLKAPFLLEASRDMDLKANYRKPHNILSGVGSKVKHSISKMKKAITCSSSQFLEEDIIIKLNKNKKI